MKHLLYSVLFIMLAGCQSNSHLISEYKPTYDRHVSDLDDPKYLTIDPSNEALIANSCQSTKLLGCLSATPNECTKMQRKEYFDCGVKFKKRFGEITPETKDFSDGYFKGCVIFGMVKYGKLGPNKTFQCIRGG